MNPQKTFGKSNKTVGHILRNDKTKAKRVNFSNTCGFDAFVACLCTLYRDKQNKEQGNEIETNMELLIKYLVNTGYDKRAEALKELILSQMLQVQSNMFNSVDCNNNVCFFLEKSDFFSYNLSKSCECVIKNKRIPFIYINAKRNGDIADKISSLVKDAIPTQKTSCTNGHIYEIQLEFSDCLYFTLTMFDDSKNLFNIISNPHVPEKIVVNNFTYILKCIVNFRAPRLKNGIGHYQAYCRTPLGGWEVYDNSQSNVLTMEEFLVPHLFIYAKEQLYK